MIISPWVLHRDPRFFDDPDAFRPERWSDGLAERLPRFAYFPHSAGPRGCPGEAFTGQETVLVLAAVAHRFRLSLVPGQDVRPSPVLLRPKGGLRMTVHRRK